MSDWTKGDDPVYDGYRENWKEQAEAEYEADRAEEEERHDIIVGIPTARLRELADAEREGRVVVLPVKQGTRFYAANRENGRIIEQDFDEYELTLLDKNGWGYVAFEHGEASEIFATKAEAARALAEPKGEATT